MKQILILAIALIGMVGCSKKEEPVPTPVATDIRDKAIGNYTGKLTFYDMAKAVVNTTNVSLKVVKSNLSDGRIDVYDASDNTIIFYATGLKEASNGVVFLVPKQVYSDYYLEGSNNFTLGTDKYDGLAYTTGLLNTYLKWTDVATDTQLGYMEFYVNK